MIEKKNLFLKIYFLVGAVAGLIGALIGFGGLISNVFQKTFISDEEYIAGSMYYELENCKQPIYGPVKTDGTTPQVAKTPEEITKCQNEATVRLSKQRAYQMKSEMITGSVRGTLFLIVFLTHLPWLRRQYNEDKA